MKIETILDHQSIFENRRPQIFFAVRFQSPSSTAPTPAPAAYCLVLDQSASVDERAFILARRFATQFIRHLPQNAYISLVTFHEIAEAIADLAAIADKPALQTIVERIAPVDFGTNLSAALLLAREQLTHAPKSVTTRKIILLTDGEHTAGIRDEHLLAQIAADIRAQEIQITSIHLNENNSTLLHRVSANYHPKLRGENLLAILAQELGGLQPLAAQNIRLRLRALDFCEHIQPLGVAFTERSDGWNTVNLGDMLSGEERTVCFNLTIPLFPWIDDQPSATLANESLLEIEAGYEEITPTAATPRIFSATVRIPTLSNTTYPPSDDGSLTLRDE